MGLREKELQVVGLKETRTDGGDRSTQAAIAMVCVSERRQTRLTYVSNFQVFNVYLID